jgi:Na+/H+ antiporter NhaD/arsenite permease-like protein
MFAQIIAIVIFLGMFLLIILDKFERHYVTLCSGILVLTIVFGVCMHSFHDVWETLNLGSFFERSFWYGVGEEATTGINWSTILFIAGMMIMVEGLGKAGFFRWLCLSLAKLVHYRIIPFLICFMTLSAILSMFTDSITVVLFLATVTLELSQTMKFDPVPMILSEIFCANLGGAATMCGDPPNIIIGTSLGYTFSDFITNTGVIVAICFVLMLAYFTLCFRKELGRAEQENGGAAACPAPATAITNRPAFFASAAVFLLAVVLLITHAQTELSVACIGVIVAVLTMIVSAITSGKETVAGIIKGMDYKTLLFFIGLFVSVAGLEETGVLDIIAQFISSVSGGSAAAIVIIILWVSAITSAFVDNIPFAATMIPVIRAIAAAEGMDISVLAWTLSIGTDLGGNATPIGASANVVGTSVSAKCGYPISWGRYCKYCAPATILVMLVSTVYLLLRYL